MLRALSSFFSRCSPYPLVFALVVAPGCRSSSTSAAGLVGVSSLNVQPNRTPAGPPAGFSAAAAENSSLPLVPGSYGMGLLVSYDPRRRMVTGWYRNATGWDEQRRAPRFTCQFYFAGHLPVFERAAHLDVWEVDLPQPGRLEVLSPQQIRLTFARELGGCWNVDPDISNHISREGTVFSWNADESREESVSACTRLPLRRVRAAHAQFFDAPKGPPRSAYVVKNDIVCVLAERPGWLQARYDETQGWLQNDDVEPLF